MYSTKIDITEEDWLQFEQKFNMSRSDVVEIQNHYRTPLRLFIKKNETWCLPTVSDSNVEYAIYPEHDWHLFENK